MHVPIVLFLLCGIATGQNICSAGGAFFLTQRKLPLGDFVMMTHGCTVSLSGGFLVYIIHLC